MRLHVRLYDLWHTDPEDAGKSIRGFEKVYNEVAQMEPQSNNDGLFITASNNEVCGIVIKERA